ncbi:hypothetical protein P154DRAFT_528129 [Amniculicola lignicola CBS 123094]|uniref:Ubiquitin 3 binding protein But2 C-terminal domain-containing protein n=1 Tax=Amniculicola lignicola CBS 123094 TaxID=1392246 RepID=A0A6A5VVP7_9PLEO|nr:hypothetical protein P154DRAFT_528129 [Amniculicola lignicola CBS 123094]
MQYTTLLLAAVSATTAFASPYNYGGGHGGKNEVVVTLGSAKTVFSEHELGPHGKPAEGIHSWNTVSNINIQVGKGIAKQDLRCQALDSAGVPYVATRGDNVDITFADGGKGPWKFVKPNVHVAKVVCDPAFVKVAPSDLKLTVQLSGPDELATQTTFPPGVREAKAPIGSQGPYNSVTLTVGKLVAKQDYRCKVLTVTGRTIKVSRGDNKNKKTFGDGGKGAWTFSVPMEAEVGSIVCDPAFQA